MAKVVDALAEWLRTRRLGSPGLVAVSSGADSVALLRGLHGASGVKVVAAHFNHRLRGAESDADEAFVRELAGRLGVPFHVGSADVRAVAAGGNLEATARRLRYYWLARCAADVGAAWVATGHTSDDQAETVLHRLIRGTGLHGLRGIAAERSLPPSPLAGEGLGVRGGASIPGARRPSPQPSPPRGEGAILVVRPLLAVTRADVLVYLDVLGQSFREDATNADPGFTRNRIRHELLPLLKTFNPDVAAALGRLAEQAGAAVGELDRSTALALEACERPRAGALLVFDVIELAWLTEYRLADLFRRVWEREGWPLGAMSAAHWRRLTRVVDGAVPAADFPGGVSARRVGAVVQLGQRT